MMHRARDDTRRGEGKEGRTYQIDSSSIDRDLISCAGKTCKSNETAEPRTPIIVVCVTVERLVNPAHERTGKKEREEERNYTEPPKPSVLVCERASKRAVVEANVSNVDIARERERGSGRENSWLGCHGHRPHSSRHDECVNSQGGRHDGNSYGRLAVHSGDAMSPDTRRELVGSRLMVLVQPAGGGGVQRERCRKGRAQSSPLCLLPVLQKEG